MEVDKFPAESTASIPAADIRASIENENVTTTRTFPVRTPEADSRDFVVEVLASTLNRCRSRLKTLALVKFPWAEFFLAIAMLSFGGTLGAIAGNVAFAWMKGFLFLPPYLLHQLPAWLPIFLCDI